MLKCAKPRDYTVCIWLNLYVMPYDKLLETRIGSVSALKSKGPWFKPGPVQDFSHISDLLGLSGWLGVIGTECGLWIGTSS